MALGRDQIAWFFALFFFLFVIVRLTADPGLRENAPLPASARGRRDLRRIGRRLSVLLTLALAVDSNRPSIIIEARLEGVAASGFAATAVVPDLYGVDGPLAEFWGAFRQVRRDRSLPRPKHGRWSIWRAGARRSRRDAVRIPSRRPRHEVLSGLRRRARPHALGRYARIYAALLRSRRGPLASPADATFPICALLSPMSRAAACIACWQAEMRWRIAPTAAVLALFARRLLGDGGMEGPGCARKRTDPDGLRFLAAAVTLLAGSSRAVRRACADDGADRRLLRAGLRAGFGPRTDPPRCRRAFRDAAAEFDERDDPAVARKARRQYCA